MGWPSLLMKTYKLPCQATCRYLYVMGNAPHLEGLVIMKRACTKQAEAHLAQQMRVIAVPSIIQNVFWASLTCEWLLAALEAFSDGWVFGKPVYMIPGLMKHQSVIPEVFLQCEHSLQNWTEIIRLFTRDCLRGRKLFIHTFYNFKLSFCHFLLSSLN